jgi:hypothetical protein
MKNISSRGVSVWLVVLLTVLLVGIGLNGCDDATGSTNDDTDDPANGGADPAVSDLTGIWLNVFDTPFTYEEGHSADAMMVEFSGTTHTMLFFSETYQNGGNKGSFTATATQINASPTHTWNRENYWVVDTVPFGFPYSLSGSVLTLTAPDQSQIPLTKTSFSRPVGLVGTWEGFRTTISGSMIGPSAAMEPEPEPDETATTTLNSDGSYTYADTIEWESGDPGSTHSESGPRWEATGATSGYMRWCACTFDGDTNAAHDWIASSLFLYELTNEGNTIRVYWPATGEAVFDLTLHKQM